MKKVILTKQHLEYPFTLPNKADFSAWEEEMRQQPTDIELTIETIQQPFGLVVEAISRKALEMTASNTVSTINPIDEIIIDDDEVGDNK